MKFYEEKKKLADFSKDKNSEYLNASIEQSLSYNREDVFGQLTNQLCAGDILLEKLLFV